MTIKNKPDNNKTGSHFKKSSLKEKLSGIKSKILHLSWIKRIILLILFFGLIFFIKNNLDNSKKNKVTYETTTAEKGTLITSISGSGTITSVNSTNISTKVSGIANKVYVTNGDNVTKGQKIAEITLDDYAKERQTTAWAAYLNAKENYLEAVNDKDEADLAMWQARQEVLDAQEAVDDMNESDINPATGEIYTIGEKTVISKTLVQKRKAFAVAESKYLNSDADIVSSQNKVAAALRDYQENSSTIIAPSAGVISDLSLAAGNLVSASSSVSQTSGATIVSAQTVGKISDPDGSLIATVNLSEIDIIKVKANQKVTLTLDAYPDNNFTGKVLAVNTSGNVNSGVTNYPVTIILDPVSVEVYPNMAVNVEIITDIKTDIIMIPSNAITTADNQSTVQVMKNGKVTTVSVKTGNSNDTQTEIKSGINEGDNIVTSTIIQQNNTTNQSSTTSPFSGIGRSGSTGGSGSSQRNSGNIMRIGGPPGF